MGRLIEEPSSGLLVSLASPDLRASWGQIFNRKWGQAAPRPSQAQLHHDWKKKHPISLSSSNSRFQQLVLKFLRTMRLSFFALTHMYVTLSPETVPLHAGATLAQIG